MKMRVPASGSLILVPFSLDESMEKILVSAGNLALVTGSRLRLMHVIKPPMGLNFSGRTGDGNIAEIIQNEYIRLTESAFRLAHELLPKTVSVTTTFSIDDSIVGAILKEANEHSAALIICGIANASHKYLPQGFSTVLSLMANSSIPVLALGQENPFLQKPVPIQILVADDLQDGGRAVAAFAASWASECENIRITHLHVNSIPKTEFSASFLTTLSPFYSPMKAAVDTDELYEHYHASLQRKLDSRLLDFGVKYEDLKGRYETMLLIGTIFDEISNVAVTKSSNIIAFGRHHLFHAKSLALGSVSFRMMLQLKHPILVVPSVGNEP